MQLINIGSILALVLYLGVVVYTELLPFSQVGNNGIVSMGWEFPHRDAALFPTEQADIFYTYVAAPFWGDADTRKAGEVYYEVHATGTPASDDLINRVSAFIHTEEGVTFVGNWMLVVHWNAVHPWPHGKPGSSIPVLEAVRACYN